MAGNAAKNGKSRATPDGVVSVPTPSLAALVAEYERRAAIAEREGASAPLARVYELVVSELAALDGAAPHPAPAAPDRLLTAPEAAALLQTSVKWVYRTAAAGRLPFARHLSPHVLRFSQRGLEMWLARR